MTELPQTWEEAERYLRELQRAPEHPIHEGKPPSEADPGDEHQPTP